MHWPTLVHKDLNDAYVEAHGIASKIKKKKKTNLALYFRHIGLADVR